MTVPESVTFYDKHPFDWAPADDSAEMNSVVSPLLAQFIHGLDINSLVLDIGCGPGRVLGFLARRGIRCIGLDRSRVSLGIAIQRYDRPGVVGDNLHLPFVEGAADAIISDGVIHHTEDPLAAFIENFGILKPGGQMYLAVYKPTGRYPALYRFPGGFIRWAQNRTWASPGVTLFFQVPYYLVHFVRSRGKRSWAGARNLFYDYFVTPRVAFLPRQLVEQWCAQQQGRIVQYDENPGQNVHSFIVAKEPTEKQGRQNKPYVENLAEEMREQA